MGNSDSRKTVEQRVISVTCEVLAVSEASIDIDKDHITDVVEDSLDQMRLYMALEDEFGGGIDDRELAILKTFRDVIEFLEQRGAAALML